MPLLADLKEQLQRLPEKKELKNLTGHLKKYAELTHDAARLLAACREEVRLARVVFTTEEFEKSEERVRRSARLAAKLKTSLAEHPQVVTTASTEKEVTSLGEQAKAARNALKERWQHLLKERIAPHERLVEVVRELLPQGGDRLGQLLDSLRSRVNQPPATRQEADMVRDCLEDLPRVIESLGLQGEVGEFLVQAAGGQGDPRTLCRTVVRDFFEERGLWGLLRVQIR